jgi:bifunctional DNA-binding transcriptional regulator/antitoxin component of YhaV-PrlF toxin-antitoxin module
VRIRLKSFGHPHQNRRARRRETMAKWLAVAGLVHSVRLRQNGSMARSNAHRYKTKIDSAGRVLIPVELRKKLVMRPGAIVTVSADRGGVRVESRRAAVGAAQEYFRGLAPESEVWSDELIAERRREARRELAG